jgi:hypothetical protein
MAARRPRLTIEQILAWADAHHARTGRWPRILDPDAASLPAGLTWRHLDLALRLGLHGLPGGDSLPRVLARERGARNPRALPRLTEGRIAAWARDDRRRTGYWPTEYSGPVAAAAGEDWKLIDNAPPKRFPSPDRVPGLARGVLATAGRSSIAPGQANPTSSS